MVFWSKKACTKNENGFPFVREHTVLCRNIYEPHDLQTFFNDPSDLQTIDLDTQKKLHEKSFTLVNNPPKGSDIGKK